MVQIQSKYNPGYFSATECFQGSNYKFVESKPLSWLEPDHGTIIDKGLERKADERYYPADRILRFDDYFFYSNGCSFCSSKEFRTEGYPYIYRDFCNCICTFWIVSVVVGINRNYIPVSYTHLRAHETVLDLVCRLLLE